MKTTGKVNGIISNIVIVKADGAVGQNEICHVYAGETKMMAEVIKVIGDDAHGLRCILRHSEYHECYLGLPDADPRRPDLVPLLQDLRQPAGQEGS